MSKASSGRQPGSEKCILVVDDEEPNLALLSSLLANEGYSICSAGDGQSALDLLAREHVDLVLLDMLMPRMDGIEVCSEIRKLPKLATLPVIFTTGLSDRSSRKRALGVGADDLLIKPVDVAELLLRVESHLRLAEARRLLAVAQERGSQLSALAQRHRAAFAELKALAELGAQPTPALLAGLERIGAELSEHGESLAALGDGPSRVGAHLARAQH